MAEPAMAITGHSDFVPCARASIGRTGATAGHDRQKMSMRVLKEESNKRKTIRPSRQDGTGAANPQRMNAAVPKATASTKE